MNVAASLLILLTSQSRGSVMQGCMWILTRYNKQLLSPLFSVWSNKSEAVSHFPTFIRTLWKLIFSAYFLGKKKDTLCKYGIPKWCNEPWVCRVMAHSELLFWRAPLWASFPAPCSHHSVSHPHTEIPRGRKITKPFLVSSGVTSSAQSKAAKRDNQAVWQRRPAWGATTADSLFKHQTWNPWPLASPTILTEPSPTTPKSTEKQNNEL